MGMDDIPIGSLGESVDPYSSLISTFLLSPVVAIYPARLSVARLEILSRIHF